MLLDAHTEEPTPGDATPTEPPRTCTKCGASKPPTEFYRVRRADRPAGYNSCCKPCQLAAQSRSAARATARGQCRSCTNLWDRPGSKQCSACRAKESAGKKRLYYARSVAGLCVACGAPATASVFCLRCWFAGIASVTLRNRGAAPMLRALLDAQSGRCALTGEPIAPGVNASLDHVVPRAKGGAHDASNLRWVTLAANIAKSDLSDDEFIALCRRVVEHADRPHPTKATDP